VSASGCSPSLSTGSWKPGLPRDWRGIVGLLRDAGQLSTGEVAEAIGVSRPTASARLKVLQAAGMVEWSGKSPKDPRASWSLSIA
jgi:ATP-dependent DNA helicase RecG